MIRKQHGMVDNAITPTGFDNHEKVAWEHHLTGKYFIDWNNRTAPLATFSLLPLYTIYLAYIMPKILHGHYVL